MFRFSVLALSCLLPICAWPFFGSNGKMSLRDIIAITAQASCNTYDEVASDVHYINAKKSSQQHDFSFPHQGLGDSGLLIRSKEHHGKLISDNVFGSLLLSPKCTEKVPVVYLTEISKSADGSCSASIFSRPKIHENGVLKFLGKPGVHGGVYDPLGKLQSEGDTDAFEALRDELFPEYHSAMAACEQSSTKPTGTFKRSELIQKARAQVCHQRSEIESWTLGENTDSYTKTILSKPELCDTEQRIYLANYYLLDCTILNHIEIIDYFLNGKAYSSSAYEIEDQLKKDSEEAYHARLSALFPEYHAMRESCLSSHSTE